MRSHRPQIPLFPFLTRYLQSLDRGQRLTAVALLNTDVCSKSNEMEVWVITINFNINNHIDDDSTTTITNNRDNNR